MTDGGKPQKISIGFSGGQSLAMRSRPAEIARLRRALGGTPEGWFDMETEDGAVALDLTQVVYVLADTEAHRVGFGT